MEQVGRYRLHEQIGRTDVASIHRAYEVTGGGLVRPVTLKRMLPGTERKFERDAVLVEEARIQEQLDHPNVVKIVDLDQSDGVWFSVEDRIEGRDLGTLLSKARQRGQKIDHDAALFIVIQILQGLAHAHARTGSDGRALRILHRDVCPRNAFIGYDGTIRIGGFGYAAIEGRPDPGTPGLDRPRYGYLSPEQAAGGALDHRSDTFAAGLILWELIAGHPAYEGSDADLLVMARRGAVPGIRTAAPDAGPELHEVIEHATASNPEQRHASAQVFRDELANILFKREPTYGASRLAGLVARILADEVAEDRKKDAEARAALRGRTLPSFSSRPPAVAPLAPAPPAAVAEPEPPPAPEPVLDQVVEPASFTGTPPVSATQPRFGKLVAGVAVLALVGVAIFALSSEANMHLVKRKAREAVLGRKPGGNLTIDSLPPGALVFLDGVPTGKTTPITIENVESQVVHDLELRLDGEEPVTATVSVAASANQTITLVFEKVMVDLSVKADPKGAEVYKNGRSVGFAPTTLPVRAGEPFALVVKKVGYRDFEQEITPGRGQPIALDVKLEKTDELMAAEAAEEEALRAAEGKPRKLSKKRKRRRR